MLVMMLLMAFPLLGLSLFLILPWRVALPCYLAGVAVSLVYHRAMMQSQKKRVTTGRRGMLGRTATVISWDSRRGTVRCHGEVWNAALERGGPVVPGDEVRVVGYAEPMVLVVAPVDVTLARDAGAGDTMSPTRS